MKSARRQAFIARKVKRENKSFPFVKLLIPLVILAAIFLFFKLNTHVWNSRDKTPVVFRQENGDIGVTILDPVLTEITTLVIPGDTEVNVSRNYGTFRLKNVWQMGINEKVGGSLLAETVTQNFLFPVVLWNGGVTGLDTGNYGKLLRFIFAPGKSNISISDRIYMTLFSLKIQDIGRSEINLGKSKFLDKKTLNDGQTGYVIAGPISQRLTVYFSDNELSDQNIKVNITDATGLPGVSDKLGEILQVIGGKVVSVDKKTVAEDSDCVISGKSSIAVKKVAYLFSCKIVSSDTSYDIDIRIGKEFAKRF